MSRKMHKRLDSKDATLMELEKRLEELELLMCNESISDYSAFEKYMELIGPLLVDIIVEICETALDSVYWDYASPDGTLSFPSSMEELADIRNEYGFEFPVLLRAFAKYILDIKKECNKNKPDFGMIEALSELAVKFLEGLANMAEDSREIISHASAVISRLSSRLRECKPHHRERRFRDSTPRGAVGFKVIENIDEYSDEELDEIYRSRTKNKDKHIAPVYIMEMMMRESDKNNRLGPNDVLLRLRENYSLEIERKAVSRALRQLEEADFLCVDPNEPSKYWYDPEIIEDAREDPYF